MRPADYARLFVLAAIWGASFIFMRVLAPALGPVVTADLRILLAGFALLLYFAAVRFDPEWRRFAKHYFVLGLLNSGLPFTFYAFAALHLPAAYSAIINSLSPLFGAWFAALWLGEALTRGKLVGLILGIAGVTLVAAKGGAPTSPNFLWGVLACVAATICYGLAGVYLKKFMSGAKPLAVAGCSQLAAGLVLAPSLVARPPTGLASPVIVLNLLGLSLLGSAVAYAIYYRLMRDVGPTRTLTVTFIVPGFGLLWGALFLGERVTLPMLVGLALVLAGTLAVGGTFKAPFSPRPRSA